MICKSMIRHLAKVFLKRNHSSTCSVSTLQTTKLKNTSTICSSLKVVQNSKPWIRYSNFSMHTMLQEISIFWCSKKDWTKWKKKTRRCELSRHSTTQRKPTLKTCFLIVLNSAKKTNGVMRMRELVWELQVEVDQAGQIVQNQSTKVKGNKKSRTNS